MSDFHCKVCGVPSESLPDPASSWKKADHLTRWFQRQGWTCDPHPLCGSCSAWRAVAPRMLRGVAAVLKAPAEQKLAPRPGSEDVPAWRMKATAIHAHARPLVDARRRSAPAPVIVPAPEPEPAVAGQCCASATISYGCTCSYVTTCARHGEQHHGTHD